MSVSGAGERPTFTTSGRRPVAAIASTSAGMTDAVQRLTPWSAVSMNAVRSLKPASATACTSRPRCRS